MLESKKIFILGYSGHAFVVIDAALYNGMEVKGYFDREKVIVNPYKVPYLGDERKVDIVTLVNNDYIFPSVGDNVIRKKLVEFIEDKGLAQYTLISKGATLSKSCSVEKSTFIGANAVVNSQAVIEKGCIINTGAVIEHECYVQSFSHVAPNAVLLGNVRVGKNSFVGANAVIKQGLTIGDNVVIGAGAVVLKNLPSNSTWVGNPAKNIIDIK